MKVILIEGIHFGFQSIQTVKSSVSGSFLLLNLDLIYPFFSNLDHIYFFFQIFYCLPLKNLDQFSHMQVQFWLLFHGWFLKYVVYEIGCGAIIPLSNTSVSQVLQWRVSLPQSLLGFEEHRSIDKVFNLKQDRRYSKARNG